MSSIITGELKTSIEQLKKAILELSKQIAELSSSGSASAAELPPVGFGSSVVVSTNNEGVQPAIQSFIDEQLLEQLGINLVDFRNLQNESRSVLEKLQKKIPLSKNELKWLEGLTPDKLALLTKLDKKLEMFNLEKGSVVRVVFTFRNKNILVSNKIFKLVKTQKTINKKMDTQLMNSVSYQTELLFIVMYNNKKLSVQEVCDALHTNLFKHSLSNILTSNIVLETIQLQEIHPRKISGGLMQAAYTTPGKLNSAIFDESLRPFSFVLNPILIQGSRNEFLLRIYGVPVQFDDHTSMNLDLYQQSIAQIAEILTNTIVIGPTRDLTLQLCVKTSRQEFSKTPYLAVTGVWRICIKLKPFWERFWACLRLFYRRRR